jgi:hypothetical protein
MVYKQKYYYLLFERRDKVTCIAAQRGGVVWARTGVESVAL